MIPDAGHWRSATPVSRAPRLAFLCECLIILSRCLIARVAPETPRCKAPGNSAGRTPAASQKANPVAKCESRDTSWTPSTGDGVSEPGDCVAAMTDISHAVILHWPQGKLKQWPVTLTMVSLLIPPPEQLIMSDNSAAGHWFKVG